MVLLELLQLQLLLLPQFPMGFLESFKVAVYGQVTQFFVIDEDALATWVLNFDIAPMDPILRMVNNSGSNHVHIDINNTAQKVLCLFDNRGMIAVLPECAFSLFSLAVLLARSSGHKLDRPENLLSAGIIVDDQVDMI